MPTLEKRRHFIFDCAGHRAYRAATLPRSVSDGGMTTFIGTGRGAECQSASRSTATALMVSRWVLMLVRGGSVSVDSGVSLKLMMEISCGMRSPCYWKALIAPIAISSLAASSAVGRREPD